MSIWIYKLLRRHLTDQEIATFTEKQLIIYIVNSIIEEELGYYPYDEDYTIGDQVSLAIDELKDFVIKGPPL